MLNKTLGKERALTESSSHLTLPHKTLGKERAITESSSHLTLPHTILEQGFHFSKQNKCFQFLLKFPAFSFAFSHDTYYVSQNLKIQAGFIIFSKTLGCELYQNHPHMGPSQSQAPAWPFLTRVLIPVKATTLGFT